MICSIEPTAGCMVQPRGLLDRCGFFDYSQGCVFLDVGVAVRQ
jgi:hypothetical protein